ncbi:MAG: hypothetical protein PPHEESC_5733 [uncultured Paraburkholderia sp.]|nr:MAG: hypothetical protein PPHEESC_5733 [uncultured Paraburkholderia sp.]CAH2942231.1 MAG: hypothetical protein PPHEMADMSA_5705 [uncultured Paraburkholderia sp.]
MEAARSAGLRELSSTGFGMAVLPQRRSRLAINGPAAGRPRGVNSAVFHNASLNAHIEWRFT